MTGDLLTTPPVVERRLVSVLFADLVGFTAWSAGRDPEDVRDLLSGWFDPGPGADRATGRDGREVHRRRGDGGLGRAGGQGGRRRAGGLAALDVVTAVAGSGEGIEAGRASADRRGGCHRGSVGEAMVAGEVVNMASRLQAAAEPGSVLVGSATMLAASARVAFEPVGELELKGIEAHVSSWRAIGAVAGPRERDRPGALVPDLVGAARSSTGSPVSSPPWPRSSDPGWSCCWARRG